MAAPAGSRLLIYAALAGSLAIAVATFIAAGLSGSSAMHGGSFTRCTPH